jgi:hypothetical protein
VAYSYTDSNKSNHLLPTTELNKKIVMKTNLKTLVASLGLVLVLFNVSLAQRTYNPRTDPRARGQSTQQQLQNQQQRNGGQGWNTGGRLNFTLVGGVGFASYMNDFVPGEKLMTPRPGVVLGGNLELKLINPVEDFGVLTAYTGMYLLQPFSKLHNGQLNWDAGFQWQPESLGHLDLPNATNWYTRFGGGIYGQYSFNEITATSNGLTTNVSGLDLRRATFGLKLFYVIYGPLVVEGAATRPINSIDEYTAPGSPMMTNLWTYDVKLGLRWRIGQKFEKHQVWNTNRGRTYGY